MSYKIFIDGQSGTTGLNIFNRLHSRADISILDIDNEKRHDIDYRQEMINKSDITFLCLPDEEAKRSVALLNNSNTVIIDTSSAHRVDKRFIYGFPELNRVQRTKLRSTQLISNPGCHSTGFISLLNPLTTNNVVDKNSNIFSTSITGYSGGGKNLINEYENINRSNILKAPTQYSLSLNHKHLPEMQKYTNLLNTPIFNPIIGDFYSGMTVSIPLFKSNLTKNFSKSDIYNTLLEYYENEPLVNVFLDYDNDRINPTLLSGKDTQNIYVSGNDNQIQLFAIFDNLGKGACGSAIMNMNILMNTSETLGLII